MPASLSSDNRSPVPASRPSSTTKIGLVELRIVASPASTLRSAQAISVNGMTLLRQAWTRKSRQVAPSRGRRRPRQRSTPSRIAPASSVRAAISVTGGIVSTPTLMKL